MTGIIFICAVSVFALAGVFMLLSEVRKILYQKIPLHITLHARDLNNEAEYYIRSLFVYYPQLGVTVIDDDPQSSDELRVLKTQYSSLLIVSP